MYIKFFRFVLDEKDLFIIAFALFLIASYIFAIPLAPFRLDSLVVLFLFLLLTRASQTYMATMTFYVAVITGLWFSMLLSPYSLALYLGIYFLILKKMGRL